jgi:hypothetical protein
MPADNEIDGPARPIKTPPSAPYLSLNQAIKLLPPGRMGRPAHLATLVRWIKAGSRGPNGESVRLQAVRMGGRWLTTSGWIEDFARGLTPSFGASPVVPPISARRKAAEQAERELDAIGI